MEVRNVAVDLGGVPILDGLDLTVARGEIVAVLGENGAGKSTLLRCLAGTQPGVTGEIGLFGRPPADDPAFWRDVVLVGDEPAWYPGLTVLEHLEMMESVHAGTRTTPGEALELFGLDDRRDHVPLAMSTGQRQRLSLAMGLLRPSRVLLLDEPERGLDAGFRVRLASILADYAADGGTVVMATHDPGLARNAGARVVELESA
ncbi:ABC transporter ATP-binding protein [Actinomadura harenae]|uniref:ABC transporter ATP-binding protein n=1 Tax=Actinomadura harenae TaxID=2483351 RepID=UPI001F4687F7|nr:ABC transporter ATP-binding protein [Actinomadura harenae]